MYMIYPKSNNEAGVWQCLDGESIHLREFDKMEDAERYVHYLNGGNNEYFNAPADGEEG